MLSSALLAVAFSGMNVCLEPGLQQITRSRETPLNKLVIDYNVSEQLTTEQRADYNNAHLVFKKETTVGQLNDLLKRYDVRITAISSGSLQRQKRHQQDADVRVAVSGRGVVKQLRMEQAIDYIIYPPACDERVESCY